MRLYRLILVLFFKLLLGCEERCQRICLLLHETSPVPTVKKYELFSETLEYHGNIIRRGCLELTSRTTDTVARLKNHTFYKQTCLVLEICNVLRWFYRTLSFLRISSIRKWGMTNQISSVACIKRRLRQLSHQWRLTLACLHYYSRRERATTTRYRYFW